MRSSKLHMAALLGVLAGMGSFPAMAPNAAPARRHEPLSIIPKRHYGLTQAQRDWNAAVDAKKAAK